MAGRSKARVESVRQDLAQKFSADVNNVEIITADIKDKASLDSMISNTDVLISMVGPYAAYGREVVKVCSAYLR
jgi:short subunit dehydrogenase-like uncharacterized protein